MLPRLSLVAGLLALSTAPALAQNFNYGSAIAAGRTEVLIGQPGNTYGPGLVYVYRPGAKGDLAVASRLKAAESTDADGFGKSIAVDGNTALISSVVADSERGTVFVFSRSATGAWQQTGKFSAPDAAPKDHFGIRVALAGDLAYVVSQRQKGAGALYVFRRSGTSWTPEATLAPSDSEPANWFGASVVAAGERVFVGAAALGGGRADSASGSVYVFSRAGGSWKQDARITPGPNTARASFGLAVLPRGDTLLVGAPGYDRGVGAVFQLARDSAGRWTPVRRLLPFDGGPRTFFGVSLRESGNELWVGAPGANDFRGQVYRFTRDSSGWLAASRMTVPGLEDQGQPFMGYAMATLPNAVVVGIPGLDVQEGGAAVFTRGPAGWKYSSTLLGDVISLASMTGSKRECTGGKVGRFDCQQVDLLSFLSVKDIGGRRGIELNDIWGYVDPETRHEYALVGRLDGTSFVDITDASHPVYVGNLPKTSASPVSVWRDIKTYKHYAFIVADGAREHGMQVFDLNRLRQPGKLPATFTEDAHYSGTHSTHNIVIDTATGYAFLVGNSSGGEMCGGGLHMVNIQDPLHPAFAGCFADSTTGSARTGYTHDAQCTVYHGPDHRFTGREICFNFSETAIGIADVTDKGNPKALSHQGYPNVGYSHQGWLTEDQHYVYADDELDEIEGLVKGTRTLIWDVSDLENPVLAGEYVSPNTAIDHNLFVVGDRVYESNYLSGLRVLDITDRIHPKPAGFFDTVPVGPDAAEFGGSWGNYPFFPSGLVAVTSMKEGLFVLKAHPVGATP